jgi:hypothetical protein
MVFNDSKYTRWYYQLIEQAKARWTEEERNKMRVPKSKYICNHCNKLVGGKSNYERWHGDNCKMHKEKILCQG